MFDEMVPDEDRFSADGGTEPVWFVCQRGNDLQIAAQRLIKRDGRIAQALDRRRERRVRGTGERVGVRYVWADRENKARQIEEDL